jgi:hypothetical protein
MQNAALKDYAGSNLVAGFSLRCDGNMSLCYADTSNSLENRKVFLRNLGIDYRDLVAAKQVHAGGIYYAKASDRGKGALSYQSAIPDTDAFITNEANVPLTIFTADCLSVFIYDQKTPAIGLVHAGWRSTKESITAKTVFLMQQQFASQPENLKIDFGPAIQPCCYEVGEDFKDLFDGSLIRRGDKYYLDLIQENIIQAANCGVPEQNINVQRICTHCNAQDLYSFRKLGSSCGRLMSVAMLK